MKNRTIFIICILLLSLQFSLGTTSANDGQAPQLHWVSVNLTNATMGDTITFTLNVTDGDEINYISAEIYVTDTSGNRYYWDTIYQYPGVASGPFYFTYTIENTEGISHISLDYIYTYDIFGYSNYYYNDKYWTNGPLFSAPDVQIIQPPPDYTAPVLYSVSLNSTYAYPDQTIRVYISAYDEGHGISYIYFGLYQDLTQLGNGPAEYREVYWDYAYFDETSGLYVADIPVNQYWRSTDYFIGRLEIGDRAGNWQYYDIYEHGYMLSSARFYLENSGLVRPVINSIEFRYDNVTTISEQFIHLNLSHNGYEFQDGYISLGQYNPEWNEYYYHDNFYFNQDYYNVISGLFEIPLTNYYNNWYEPNQDILVLDIYLYNWDTQGQYMEFFFYQNIDFQSDTFQLLDMDVIDKIFFEIKASPSSGTVGEETIFSIEVLSTYRQDLFDVELSISIFGPNTDDTRVEMVNLFENEAIFRDVAFTFTQDGIFDVLVTLVGSNGDIWEETFSYQVRGNGDDNPSTDDTSKRDEPTNSSGIPELQLPGFDLYVTIISFSAILLTTYSRRRNL